MDNGAKSSFNIELMKPTGFWHTFRRGFLAKDVRGDLSHENEHTCSFSEARQRAAQMKADADAAYYARTKKRPRYDPEKIYWEAEVNAREWHSLDDLKKAAAVIEREMGYRMICGVIHKDEGHYNDEGEFIKNVQFHIAFISLDENGISQHRKTFNPSLMSKIQTKIAQTLGMERGVSKEITGRVHLTPEQFKQAVKLQEPLKQELKLVKKDLTDAKKTIKELENALKDANKQARADLQEQGGEREDYAALEQENRLLKDELAAFKKVSDGVNVEDFSKLFSEKIKRLRHHPKIDNEVKKAIKSNGLRSTMLGDFKKEDVLAYVADAVATKQAAINTIKEAQTSIKELAVRKEIDVYKQLRALRENKIAGALFGATLKPAVDVDALQSENASLLKTFDVLQKQNKDLQTALKKATDLINHKNTELKKLQKNQEGFGVTDSFLLGQATLLSELIRDKKIHIEPKGHSLLLGLDSIVSGEYPAKNFKGIKSGLLSYAPSFTNPKNDLEM